MSGPITAGFVLVHGLLLLSARAIEEARAVKGEFDNVRAQIKTRERELADARKRQQGARLERLSSLRRRGEQQASRLNRLRSLAETLCANEPELETAIPKATLTAPASNADEAWTLYLSELASAVAALETFLGKLGEHAADRARSSIAMASLAPGIDDVLSAYVLERQLRPKLDATRAEAFRATAARILARLELPEGEALPARLETLARDIVLAPSIERAETLASELRRAVQQEREARSAQRLEANEAAKLLKELPEEAPSSLVRALEAVAAGIERLDPRVRKAAFDAIAESAAETEHLEQEAAALVLEESLRDLGYEVEAIEATLFAQGGTTHFRRPGWENYFVRLRVDPRERTVNFNVVRAKGDEESAERKRLDRLAEDRWCAEFPKLLQTLAARGLQLDVTRRLEAGELPVQVVDGALLPRVEEDESVRRSRGARGRELS